MVGRQGGSVYGCGCTRTQYRSGWPNPTSLPPECHPTQLQCFTSLSYVALVVLKLKALLPDLFQMPGLQMGCISVLRLSGTKPEQMLCQVVLNGGKKSSVIQKQ